ncbi:hypothetical protein THRCLA_22399 [Thraustotheca clavata]|uniref:Uncharacterized protein n=1 Tax=Thraustotheca clavata TaxID=74557 RepID=A0A1V9Z2U6_9STRA|nr:hypothetical protein THRCLA_22399 [Thraustotheca clavata]
MVALEYIDKNICAMRNQWTELEDIVADTIDIGYLLRQAIELHEFDSRIDWEVLKSGLKKGPWSEEEDELLINLVVGQSSGTEIDWKPVASQINGRRQVRNRWEGHLNPSINKEFVQNVSRKY